MGAWRIFQFSLTRLETRFFTVNFKTILITKIEYLRGIRVFITSRVHKAGLIRKQSLIS